MRYIDTFITTTAMSIIRGGMVVAAGLVYLRLAALAILVTGGLGLVLYAMFT